jgi:hypothetical protein
MHNYRAAFDVAQYLAKTRLLCKAKWGSVASAAGLSAAFAGLFASRPTLLRQSYDFSPPITAPILIRVVFAASQPAFQNQDGPLWLRKRPTAN